jgi:hypothetical protein
MKCAACANDGWLPDVHRPARQWWDREPGYFAEEVARIRRDNRAELVDVLTPPRPPRAIPQFTPRQIAAELARQSARLARAELGYSDFTGPRAAEEHTLARRAELGLDVSLDLLEAVA